MSAAQAALTRLYTAEELESFGSEDRHELLEGELFMPPMPGAKHGGITHKVATYAGIFAIEHDLVECFAAETRFILSRNPDTVLAPDWSFVARERLPAELPDGYLELAPDIVMEVRSPSDTQRASIDKVGRWLAAGTQLVWEINPQSRILTVYRAGQAPQLLGVNDTLTAEEILPGFSLALNKIFPPIASSSASPSM